MDFFIGLFDCLLCAVYSFLAVGVPMTLPVMGAGAQSMAPCYGRVHDAAAHGHHSLLDFAQSVAVFATVMSMTSSVIGIGACSATLAQSTAIFAVDTLETLQVSSVGQYVPTDVANR